MIKRYLCFSFYCYEPDGGIGDLIAECDTLDEAKEVFDKEASNRHKNEYQIYDLKNKVLYVRPDDSEIWDSEIISLEADKI